MERVGTAMEQDERVNGVAFPTLPPIAWPMEAKRWAIKVLSAGC
jgi:hypothetical protein